MATSTWLIRATAGTGVRTGLTEPHRPLGNISEVDIMPQNQ